MISAISASSGGLQAATQRYATAAEGIAAIGTSLPSATQVDLSTTAVQLMQEKANIGMNTAILKSTLDSERRVLDILA
jgi:phage tail protein X